MHNMALTYTEVHDCRRPALTFEERSCDFQLPDVVRPLARTSVSAIAIIARRMGMRWKDFRPVDGVMRAEGKDYILTATNVRSLGILLRYSPMPNWKISPSDKSPRDLHPGIRVRRSGLRCGDPLWIQYTIWANSNWDAARSRDGP
jgi:hypothetical protein